MTEMCSSESASARTKNNFWKKSTFGKFSYKSFEAWKLYTIWKFCTGIWKALTYFYTRMAPPSLETWMFLKLPKRDYFIPRLELPIMQVLKFGRTSLTILSQTFGRLDVLYMRCVRLSHLSELMTWMVYIKECSKDNFRLFLVITASTCVRLSRIYSRSSHHCDLIHNKSSICKWSRNEIKSTSVRKMEECHLIWTK